MGRRKSRRKSDEEAITFLICAFLAFLFMPIAGLVLLCRPSIGAKLLGVLLLVVGISLWCMVGSAAAG